MKKSSSKKAAVGAALAIASLTLSACGTNNNASGQASSSASKNQNPVLSVPETTDSKSITFKIDGGGLPEGQAFHVAAYGGDFSGKASDCSEEVAGTDGQFGDHEITGAVQVKNPGRYQLVMSTDGHASACNDPNAVTSVKTAPELFLDGDLSADGAKTIQATEGKPFDVAVVMRGSDLPKNNGVPVDLTVRGPYSTEPELRAAHCGDHKVASEQTVNWTGDKTNRSDNRYTNAKVTIDGTKGLYLITAKSQETDQVASEETECDNYQSALKVSTKGEGAKADSADEMGDEGTNALTPEKNRSSKK